MTLPENVCAPEDGLKLSANSNPCNNISSSVVPELTPSSSHFKIQITLKGQNCSASVVAMVDYGATALFISKRFIKDNKIRTHPLLRETPLYNIDGSKNHAGSIAHSTHLRLQVGDMTRWHQFLITELGPEDVVLGLPWLRTVNPKINWANGKMKVDACEKGNLRVEMVAANRV